MSRVTQDKPHASMLKTQLTSSLGSSEAGDQPPQQKVNINFYVTKISDTQKKLYGLCVVLQPIIVARTQPLPQQEP